MVTRSLDIRNEDIVRVLDKIRMENNENKRKYVHKGKQFIDKKR